MKTEPSIELTIVIPCYNEERYIVSCLDSLLKNDIDRKCWEILIVDGMSSDSTRELIERYSRQYPFVRLIDNPERIKPVALNRGIRQARGRHIMRIDAHSTYQPGYVDQLLEIAQTQGVQNVGGVQIAIDEGGTFWGAAIAAAVSNPLAMGDAVHRMQFLSEPRFVDTVFCGCYPRQVFEEVGLFNEKLIRTQDREFNERLRRSGGRILLVPSVRAFYKPRTSIAGHVRWIYQGAKWLFMAGRYTDISMVRPRNLVPIAFVSYLLLIVVVSVVLFARGAEPLPELMLPVALYALMLLVAGFILAIRKGRPGLVLSFPAIVFITHVSYGLGSIVGAFRRYF